MLFRSSKSTRQSARDEPLVLRVHELALEPLVEAPMVAETREWVGQRESHRLHGLVCRALVEGDRQQRADERDREHGLALPEDDQRQRSRDHEREGRSRLRHVLARDREEGAAGGGRQNGADQDQVDDPVVDKPAQQDPRDEDRD
jgi:hypothetical protein